MTRTIPARIENGQVIAEGPLPEGEVLGVRIVVELAEPVPTPAGKSSSLEELRALLKDVVIDDYKAALADALAEKYLK